MVQRCLRIFLCLGICAGNPLTASAFASSIGAAQGVRIYLNPHTGRFWTMDNYEGNNEDPLSLHKYLYCHDDPVDAVDPSGQMDSIVSALDTLGDINIVSRVSIPYVYKGSGGLRATLRVYYGTPRPWYRWSTAGVWGQPAEYTSGSITYNGFNSVTTTIKIWGPYTCNTSLYPGNGPMTTPKGAPVSGTGSIQTTISGAANSQFILNLAYAVTTTGVGKFSILNDKGDNIILRNTLQNSLSDSVPISGVLDSTGKATITYLPSCTHSDVSRTTTSTVTGTIAVKDLR